MWGWGARGPLGAAIVAIGATALGGWAGAAAAQSGAGSVPPGRDAYLQYCGSCHGPEGDGQGPMAAELKTPPSDLTRLAKRYGAPLPRERLLDLVDGRSMPRAHGSEAMPVWGRKLLEDVPPGAGKEAYKRGTILVILDWIEAIQRP